MEEKVIYEYEEKLRNAMVKGDVESLDKLISDNLIFVSPFGQIVNKEDDINSHRSGIVNITEIEFLNQKIIPLENGAVAITHARVQAMVAGQQREDEMYYTRVWQKQKNGLKVISGHSSFIPNN
ncbi:nuclear transport factor 2 family protein [Ureibacillus aquaedulcis]|uniref:Nuclear transport factor 2 family protein n=1 Tax=Ureibacillus aquaedulcis TaxID=3058421 RepID=A0ABT8GTJ8_9BACL|nr:nuclear transport factor 2 family protein [Ureibacillus sp. BA0131]MDN4494722.1 nuclear transport factor 2 family protein [Ureibacillus sp. BA0131]